MNHRRSFWQLDGEFVLSATSGVRSPYLVVSTRLDEVDGADDICPTFRGIGPVRMRGSGRLADFLDVLQSPATTAILDYLQSTVGLGANTFKDVVTWKPRVRASFDSEISRDWVAAEFPDKRDQLFNDMLLVECTLKLIGSIACFFDGLAPCSPILTVPVALCDAGFCLKGATTKGNASVRSGGSSDLVEECAACPSAWIPTEPPNNPLTAPDSCFGLKSALSPA